VTPPRTSVLDPTAWLWWPVVMAGWSLAATVMAAEMAIAVQVPAKCRRPERRR
jgi:hypothetical protein